MFDTDIEMPGYDELIERYGMGDHGRVQSAIDYHVLKFCDPYLPYDTGALRDSGYMNTDIGSGEVVWMPIGDSPGVVSGPSYAHYMYYGLVYGPNIPIEFAADGTPIAWRSPKGKPKYPTGKHLTYDVGHNPLAGSFWFERMKADRLQDIIEIAEKAAKNE